MEFLSRSDALELMDSAPLGAGELAAALRFLAWVNGRFGGYRVVLGRFEEWSRDWPPGARRSVLDVGTGWADFPLALVRWAKRRGFDLTVTGIDSTPAVAALARGNAAGVPEVEIVEADLESFARRGRKFDYVVSSLFLHHVPRERQAAVLRLCDGMAARGLVFSDLRRSIASWLGVSLVTALFGDRVTRHDGPLSVRRAFRPEELERLAQNAGLDYLETRSHPFFRLSLAGRKESDA